MDTDILLRGGGLHLAFPENICGKKHRGREKEDLSGKSRKEKKTANQDHEKRAPWGAETSLSQQKRCVLITLEIVRHRGGV